MTGAIGKVFSTIRGNNNLRLTRFSLRVFLLLPLVVSIYLAWQLYSIRERQTLKHFVRANDGTFFEDDQILREAWLAAYPAHPEVPRKSMEITWLRRALGDTAAIEINVPDSLGEQIIHDLERKFPEAHVGATIAPNAY